MELVTTLITIMKKAKTTLREHRRALAQNPQRYEVDLPRAAKTIVNHLRKCGYSKMRAKVLGPTFVQIVELLFEAQGRRPLFDIDSTLPFCWNAPKDWEFPYIRYEWGHLNSRNQNEDAEYLENLSLCSARGNQHIQTSMDIDEVRTWLAGSAIAARIDQVLCRREALFKSPPWSNVLRQLEPYRTS